MKIFLYKLLITFTLIFVLYKVTIGYTIKQIEVKIDQIVAKDGLTFLKEKLREEIKDSLNKERYIKKEDAELLNAFIKKIRKDLNNN